jgi:Ankyrin repeats (3 copies)
VPSTADPNIANAKGDYPLHWAVITGNVRCAKLLVVGGASLIVKNNQGQTPEELAAERASGANPESGKIRQCLSRAREALGILETLDFHSDESFAQVFRSFVADEVGVNGFMELDAGQFSPIPSRHISINLFVHQRSHTHTLF